MAAPGDGGGELADIAARLSVLESSGDALAKVVKKLDARIKSAITRIDGLANGKSCGACGFIAPRKAYGKKQWNKPNGICLVCAEAIRHAREEEEEKGPPTEVSLAPRPMMDVPGFEGVLQVCRDWPPTKKGNVPGTQSLIFVPLIGCVIGPVDDYYTQADIDLAMQWWTIALPAWPRWVAALQDAGVQTQREHLLKSVKGKATPLIFKSRGRGKVPHFKGKEQSAALELDFGVALEVYACCTVLYSTKRLDAAAAAELEAESSDEDEGGAAAAAPAPDLPGG